MMNKMKKTFIALMLAIFVTPVAAADTVQMYVASKTYVDTALDTIVTSLKSNETETGAVVTGVSQTDGVVTVTRGNVKIPSGGENATEYVSVWVE